MRGKDTFRIEDVIQDTGIDSYELHEGDLVQLLLKAKGFDFVDFARSNYYARRSLVYADWFCDEDVHCRFWESIEDCFDDSELTPNEKESLFFAKKGVVGRDSFAIVMDWFNINDFIRPDITTHNCRFFRYVDSYPSLARKNIMVEIFEQYETIRSINEINEEVEGLLKDYFSATDLQNLHRQVDADAECFENCTTPSVLEDLKKDIGRLHSTLKSISDEILMTIFKKEG